MVGCQGLAPSQLQAIAAAPLVTRLGPLGKRFLADTPETWSGLLLPVGFSPRVMLIRREGGTAPDPNAGWNLLLDPAFEGKLLLPSSPRLLASWRIGSVGLNRCVVCVLRHSALTIVLR